MESPKVRDVEDDDREKSGAGLSSQGDMESYPTWTSMELSRVSHAVVFLFIEIA